MDSYCGRGRRYRSASGERELCVEWFISVKQIPLYCLSAVRRGSVRLDRNTRELHRELHVSAILCQIICCNSRALCVTGKRLCIPFKSIDTIVDFIDSDTFESGSCQFIFQIFDSDFFLRSDKAVILVLFILFKIPALAGHLFLSILDAAAHLIAELGRDRIGKCEVYRAIRIDLGSRLVADASGKAEDNGKNQYKCRKLLYYLRSFTFHSSFLLFRLFPLNLLSKSRFLL